MATNILMPALSPTMTEGTLARWLKHEGDAIRAGDVIAEIETDKATMEVEAVDEGVLGKILVQDGTQNVKVNDPIAVLVQPGEAAPAAAPAKTEAPKAEAPKAATPAPVQQATAAPPPVAPPAPAAAPAPNGHAQADRVFVSPLARRMALQAGIDLSRVHGTGPQGRIVRADIEKLQSAPASSPPAAPAPTAPRTPGAPITAPHQKLPLNNVRRITARRLAEAKQSIPHFYVSIDVELDALLKLRADLNAKSPKDGPGAFKLSVNDLLIKATAVTLRRVPKVNVSFTEEAIILYDDVDISVAVSIPDGLITPIIRQADRKGLAAISNESKSLIERARAGKLKPEEFQGGSFSISNMGMYGVKDFSAIINPPQAAILAIAAGEQRPVVKNGELAVATVMTVTLSVDHRAIDGALAAEFVASFKQIVEDPLSLML
ncbi:MAG: pyruvate dehydrogenase complex dihydrolipoamide acetyltransferase [Rhodospirillales bacterium]